MNEFRPSFHPDDPALVREVAGDVRGRLPNANGGSRAVRRLHDALVRLAEAIEQDLATKPGASDRSAVSAVDLDVEDINLIQAEAISLMQEGHRVAYTGVGPDGVMVERDRHRLQRRSESLLRAVAAAVLRLAQ